MMRRAALALSAALMFGAQPALADPATETEHAVAEGETLGGIANRAGVPLIMIAEANGLAEPYDVQRGQKLTIPRQRTHTVRKGETGFAIAYRYGVPLENIAIANRLEPPYNVRIGQKLIIPAVFAAPSQTAPARDRPYFRRPHDGTMLLGWAMREDGKGHDGVDYAASPGDMVRASASGTVIFAGETKERFGRLVVIDHGNGWQSAYGHLARVTVDLGEVVKRGERIGLAGDAGDAARTELHFEIRHDGKKVDPAPLLPRNRPSN